MISAGRRGYGAGGESLGPIGSGFEGEQSSGRENRYLRDARCVGVVRDVRLGGGLAVLLCNSRLALAIVLALLFLTHRLNWDNLALLFLT